MWVGTMRSLGLR